MTPLGKIALIQGRTIRLVEARDAGRFETGARIALSYMPRSAPDGSLHLRNGRLTVLRAYLDGTLVFKEDAYSEVPAACQGEGGDYLYADAIGAHSHEDTERDEFWRAARESS